MGVGEGVRVAGVRAAMESAGWLCRAQSVTLG